MKILRYALLTTISIASFGCNTQANAEEVINRSDEFRSYLVDSMKRDGFSDAEISYRALKTPSDFRDSIFGNSFVEYSPIDLFSQEMPESLDQNLSFRASKNKPAILVIFPGIASDIIDAFVFQNALDKHAEKVELNLSASEKDRVNLTKYYDENGNQILHIIDLRSPALKMESFMPPVEQGKIFKKSIEEVFELAGFNKSNEDVYFLGYSRGVLSALTLLDEADKSSNPPLWYKTSNGKDRLKGLISLSGSLNGSFADSFYEKDDLLVATGKKLEEKLDKLVPDMKYFDENYDVIFGEAGNTEDSVIIPVLNLAELQGELPLDTTIKLNFGYTNAPFLQLPKLTDDRIKAESKGRRLDRIIGSNVNKIAGIVENLTEGLYFIDAKYRNPDCDDACKAKYARSITALKSLRYVIPGLISMQESRLKDFWSSLELPNQVKYFSLSTTLPEPHKGFVESNTQ